MEFKIAFSGDVNEETVKSILGHDDSGFEIDPRASLNSFISDPTFLATVTVLGTALNVGQLACALWEIYGRKQQPPGENPEEVLQVRIELPSGTIVVLPVEDKVRTEALLREILAAE